LEKDGDNDMGKSTLVKINTDAYRPDSSLLLAVTMDADIR
jgi:ABC-type sugar transport system ATPase subunit